MAAPEHIAAQIRAYLLERVVPVLPAEIHTVAIEVVSWHVQIHMYQYEVLEDLSDSTLEERIQLLAGHLTPRPGERWQVTPAFHRRERSSQFAPEGEVVYAVNKSLEATREE